MLKYIVIFIIQIQKVFGSIVELQVGVDPIFPIIISNPAPVVTLLITSPLKDKSVYLMTYYLYPAQCFELLYIAHHTCQEDRFGSTLMANKDLYLINRREKCINLRLNFQKTRVIMTSKKPILKLPIFCLQYFYVYSHLQKEEKF